MDRKELEKIFYDRFDVNKEWINFSLEDYTEFIFETIIPKVLNSVIDVETSNVDKEDWEYFDNNFKVWAIITKQRIKHKAKELYDIDL